MFGRVLDRTSITIALGLLALIVVGQLVLGRYTDHFQEGVYYDDVPKPYDDSAYGGNTYEYIPPGDTYSYDGEKPKPL